MLLKQLREKEGAYESLLRQIQCQENERVESQAVRPPSKAAGNGAVFVEISTPVGRQSQPGPGSFGFMLDEGQPLAQDVGSIRLLGKCQSGRSSGEHASKMSKGKEGSKSSKQNDTFVSQLSSLVEQFKSASRSPSNKASSSGSSSSSSRKGGGSPGGSPVVQMCPASPRSPQVRTAKRRIPTTLKRS